MSSIYNQSTNVGNTGRFAPQVTYNVATRAVVPHAPELKDLDKDEDGFQLDVAPIAEALIKSQELDFKKEMQGLEYDFNLRKLEAAKEKEKSQQKDYSVLKQVSDKIQALELAAPGMSPKQYQTERKNIVDTAIANYKGNPADVYNILGKAGWGFKEEIISLRKDQSQWEQDKLQGQVDAVANNNKSFAALSPEMQMYAFKTTQQSLDNYVNAQSVMTNPDSSDVDKTIANETMETNGVNLATSIYQSILGSEDIGDLSNPASLMTIKENVTKMLTANVPNMHYGQAKLLSDLAADRIGLSDLAADANKKFTTNKQYIEDYNSMVSSSVELQMNKIPFLRVYNNLPTPMQEHILTANPLMKDVVAGTLQEFLSYEVTEDYSTLKVLGETERLEKAVSGEAPSVTLGRQHVRNNLTPLDMAVGIVDKGNRGGNKNPYADYYWYVGKNGVQATLANQALNVQTVDDVNVVANNIKNGDKLINSPVAKDKTNAIVAADGKNPVVQKLNQADKAMEEIKQGLLALQNMDDVPSILQSAAYLRQSVHQNRLRVDTKNGKIVVLEDAKGVVQTLATLNDLNIFANVSDFNKRIEKLPLEKRNAIAKWGISSSKYVAEELKDGDIIQEEPGWYAQALGLVFTTAGIGVDAGAQGIETIRQNSPKVLVKGAKKLAEVSEKVDPYVLTPADVIEAVIPDKVKQVLNPIKSETTEEEKGKGKWVNASTDKEVYDAGPIENAVKVDEGVLMGWEEYTDMYVIRDDNVNEYYKFRTNGDERPFEEIYKDFKEGKIKAEETFKYVQ